MKNSYLLLAAACTVALAAACQKEEQAPVSDSQTVEIQAYIDNTRTAYADGTKFSWVSGDYIYLPAYRKSDGALGFYYYQAQSSGTRVKFMGNAIDTNDWDPVGLALYPGLDQLGQKNSDLVVVLPAIYYTNGSAGDMSYIPLIGAPDANEPGVYRFRTAVGVLKVTLANVPVNARVLTINSGSVALSGQFPLDEEAYNDGFEIARCSKSPNTSVSIFFWQKPAGSTQTIYIPVPVGTIPAGAELKVLDEQGNVLKSTEPTKKAIEVTRGHVIDITPNAPIPVEDWVSMGTGKFMDDYIFGYLGYTGRSASAYHDVEVQKLKGSDTKFRLVNPYGSFYAKHGITTMPGANGPDEYFYFTLSDDIVLNDSQRTGIAGPNRMEIGIDHPYWGLFWGGFNHNWRNSFIIGEASGAWTNIQLAPDYFDGSFTTILLSRAENPSIEIVAPGASPMIQDYFGYPENVTVSTDDGVITVNWSGSKVSSVDVALGSSRDDAIQKLVAGNISKTFTSSSSWKVEDEGTHFVAAKINTNGHGWVYKEFGSFTVESVASYPEIHLTVDMLSPIATETTEGSVAGLCDGVVSSDDPDDSSWFWHSPWTVDGTYDPVYGIYIDIDLGAGKEIKDFELQFCLRPTGNDHAKHVKVFASNDKASWGSALAENTDVYGAAAKDGWRVMVNEWTRPFECHAASKVRYIRLAILSTYGANGIEKDLTDASQGGCTHIAEIRLFGE